MRLPMSKSHMQWSAILGCLGIAVACWLIFTSNAYTEAKKYLYTDPEIRTEFGEIKYSLLYSANIKNEHARFLFYLIGGRKSATVALHASEIDGHWVVARK